MSEIARVGVVGLGLMGSGIAEVLACAGVDVIATEVTAESLAAGLDRLHASLARAASKGRLTEQQAAAAADRVSGSTAMETLSGCDLIIEAAVENLEAKLAIFGSLNDIADEHTILASNTSSIPITNLAAAVSDPGRVVGVHFFNPAPVMDLVEIIAAAQTRETTISMVTTFVSATLHKAPIVVPDRAGFVVNALLIPYLLSAIRMLESGRATAEDIDTGMRLGCGHPMGPLALADLIGLDVVAAAAAAMYDEYREPQYASPPLLKRMITAGWLGRKTGRGFHEHTA